jgi:putative mRNA 3-end processing factor
VGGYRALLRLSSEGLFCESGGFHIDPRKAVENALITHAHSDHARKGSHQYFCHRDGLGLLRSRLGSGIRCTGLEYGERRRFGPMTVSFHPAGHILGSSQVRVESPEGEVWVVSGDYKREPDPTCAPFEPLRCDVFVTDATFGAPAYRWSEPPGEIGRQILSWRERCAAEGRSAVLFAYSVGKAQRLLAELARLGVGRVWVHPQVAAINESYRAAGIELGELSALPAPDRSRRSGELLVLPPGAQVDEWAAGFGPLETAFVSGWVRRPGQRFGRYDRGFMLSDHADWPGVLRTVEETGALRVFVACRDDGALVRALRRNGLEAHPVSALAGSWEPQPLQGLLPLA